LLWVCDQTTIEHHHLIVALRDIHTKMFWDDPDFARFASYVAAGYMACPP